MLDTSKEASSMVSEQHPFGQVFFLQEDYNITHFITTIVKKLKTLILIT